ncbi:MAG: hypothetical protein V5A72_01620 [Candidatus Nanohaloarchaea archaeon]
MSLKDNNKFSSVRDNLPDLDFTNKGVAASVLMGDPYYGTNKGLKGRKGYLVQNDFFNVLGMRDHTEGDGRGVFDITESGNVEVAGHPVEELNEEIGKELTVFPTSGAVESLGGKGTRAIAESDELNVVNPKPLYSLANHKGDQHWLFDKSPAPIPPFVHSSQYSADSPLETQRASEQLVDDFDEINYNGPIVVKADNGGRGMDIRFFDSPAEYAEEWSGKNQVPDNQVIQAKIDPLYDERIIVGGDITYITAERRYGDPDDELCNLTQVGEDEKDEEELWFGDKLDIILEEGLAAPENMENLDSAKKKVIEDVYETVMSYVEDEFGFSDSYRRNFRGSIDLLVWDPDDQNHLPESMVDEMMEYETKEGYGLTPIEWNNQSGSMVDVVNMMYPEQDSAANLAKQMYSMSEGEEFKERGLPYNMTHGDMIPEGGVGEQRENNRFFGLYRKAKDEIASMSAEELYQKSKSNPKF